MTDVRPYTSTLLSFWETSRADALEQLLLSYASSLACKIQAAPDFRPDFPLIEEPAPPAPRIAMPMFAPGPQFAAGV